MPDACRASHLASRDGTPARSRTWDRRFRKAVLYPAELRARAAATIPTPVNDGTRATGYAIPTAATFARNGSRQW